VTTVKYQGKALTDTFKGRNAQLRNSRQYGNTQVHNASTKNT